MRSSWCLGICFLVGLATHAIMPRTLARSAGGSRWPFSVCHLLCSSSDLHGFRALRVGSSQRASTRKPRSSWSGSVSPPDDPDNLVAKEEYYQTAEQIRLESERLSEYGNVWKAVVKKKSYRKRMVIGFLTQWGAEFGGPLIIVSILLVKVESSTYNLTEQLRGFAILKSRHEGRYAFASERSVADNSW